MLRPTSNTELLVGRVCFGLAMILLGTGTSMNNWQRYGEGWLDGECYLVRTGVYLGVAALVVVNLVLNLSLTQVCSWCLEKGYNSLPINIPGTLFYNSMEARRQLCRIVAKILSFKRQRKVEVNDLVLSWETGISLMIRSLIMSLLSSLPLATQLQVFKHGL